MVTRLGNVNTYIYKKDLIHSTLSIFHEIFFFFFNPLKEEQNNFLFEDTLISRIISLTILSLILLANSFQPQLAPVFQGVY